MNEHVGRSIGPAFSVSGDDRARELAKLERIRAGMGIRPGAPAQHDDLASALDEWILRAAGEEGISPPGNDDPVEQARREREKRREKQRLHRRVVYKTARGLSFDAALRELSAEMKGEDVTWATLASDLEHGGRVTRLQVLRSASKDDQWCRVTYRPSGTTLGWGPCNKARCRKCVARVMEWEIAEVLAELSQHGEQRAVIKTFPGTEDASRFRRRHGLRIKGRGKTPGVRQFGIGFKGDVALIVPAALVPAEPGARSGAHLGRELFRVYVMRVANIPEPKEEDPDRRPRLRHDVSPETVELLASEQGMSFDVEHHGKAWTFFYFYECEPEDVDGLVQAANAMAPDTIGNLALARAGP